MGSTAPVGSAPPRAVRADCPPVPLWANTGRRAATGAGALVTLGFAALATRYDRTRGTGRS
ncbi:hypothetical protein OG401_03290 [Kitasatospora purpeofusca]|uniref:hypothetical protein n=1 Tax=Kitasatospora purpeofusca TaxID=67352 RepID=UPI00224DB3AB|nr:hypothetical protein [Kitasatospora purpeofusca]MCX4683339.1 hypothetical protein [Kitasatospora purpeofusca]